MKRIAITALSHPLVDILHSCDHDFLSRWGLQPGSYGLSSRAEQDSLIDSCGDVESALCLGGSAINSVACARQLGVHCSVLGLAGDDLFGQHYLQELKRLDIHVPLPLEAGARTGTCLSLINPDGERTMRTCLGVATNFASEHLVGETITSSSWLLLEGYFLTASKQNNAALVSAIRLAKSAGVKVAFSVAAEFVVRAEKATILDVVLPSTDLLFANEGEAMLLSGASSAQDAVTALSQRCPGVVVTQGKHGALGSIGTNSWHAPGFEAEGAVVDTTGAGDVFAGAFLAGLLQGLSPLVAARGANRLASLVVAKRGALLPDSARAVWEREVQQ